MRTFVLIAYGGRGLLMPEYAHTSDGRAWRPWKWGIWFRAFDIPPVDESGMTPYLGDD